MWSPTSQISFHTYEFLRHGRICQSDVLFQSRSEAVSGCAPWPHRLDESAASYSLAGWSPLEPTSASPTGFHLQPARLKLQTTASHGLRNFQPAKWGVFIRRRQVEQMRSTCRSGLQTDLEGIILDDSLVTSLDGSRLLKDASRPRIEIEIAVFGEIQESLLLIEEPGDF